ncbi:MAG: hypothetical protein HY344_00180 [Candidatus Levybacteria bacterium]|nr:hypothetical protein [Candidatus Levybacteria bacterium]
MKINAKWHKANKMPKNPSTEQRIVWHKDHIKNCSCFPVPAKLKEEMEKRG